MKIKKKSNKIFAIAILTVLLICLSGCSSEKNTSDRFYDGNSASAPQANPEVSYSPPVISGEASNGYYGDETADAYFPEEDSADLGGTMETISNSNSAERKIVYSANFNLETTSLDDVFEKLTAYLTGSDINGYIEKSELTGSSIEQQYYPSSQRRAAIVVRIPADKYITAKQYLSAPEYDDLWNVLHSSESTDDVTVQYFDLETKLSTLRIQQSHLLEMMESAVTVEEMLTVEREIQRVTYEIESHTTTLNKLASLVSYSTISINISEVFIYSEQQEKPPVTFGERMGAAISSGFTEVADGLGNAFIGFLYVLPGLAAASIIVAIVLIIILGALKKNRAKQKENAVNPPNQSETSSVDQGKSGSVNPPNQSVITLENQGKNEEENSDEQKEL